MASRIRVATAHFNGGEGYPVHRVVGRPPDCFASLPDWPRLGVRELRPAALPHLKVGVAHGQVEFSLGVEVRFISSLDAV